MLVGSLDGMLKNYCHISNQRPPNRLIATLHAKIRILKFGTKKCVIWVFWAVTLNNQCYISNQHPRICLVAKCQISVFWSWNLKKLLSYLKSASSNLSCYKVLCKNKNP